MSTKHTPGPWHPGHLGSDSTCQCKSVVDEGYAGGICTVHVDNGLLVGEGGNDAPPRDEAIANMRLIAAAPEMLEVLKGILEYPREGNPRRSVDGYPAELAYDEFAYKRMVDSYRDAARAAIAKAEGRS